MVTGEEGHIDDNNDVDGPDTMPSRFVSVRLAEIVTKKSTMSGLNKKRRTCVGHASFYLYSRKCTFMPIHFGTIVFLLAFGRRPNNPRFN